MKIAFEPSGTHIKDGVLKVRLDVIPEVGDKCYEKTHVSMPVFTEKYPGGVDAKGRPIDENDYQIWVDSLPHEWVDTPCLCHFLMIDKDTDLNSLKAQVQVLRSSLPKIDEILSTNSPHVTKAISAFMHDKKGVAVKLSDGIDLKQLLEDINTRFSGLEIKG